MKRAENPIAATVYTAGPAAPAKCRQCERDPQRVNSAVSECSHIACPYRRQAWSERPNPAELFKGPWPKNEDTDPRPLA